MDNYIKTALRATGEAWTVFKTSATTGQNPKLAFQQLRDKYKGTDVEGYVTDYTKICEEELPRIKNAESYMAEAKNVGNKVFQVFKANAQKVFTETMNDDDWNRIIKMASDIGYSNWDSEVKEYAKRYSALIVWELDRQYQRLHHIKDDWWKFV
jgi:hypothetical protein